MKEIKQNHKISVNQENRGKGKKTDGENIKFKPNKLSIITLNAYDLKPIKWK